MRVLVWGLRALVFFTLFAFALNNRHEVALNWFFGYDWRAPMMVVVLVAFAAGCAVGVLAMVPRWWRQRRVAQGRASATATTILGEAPATQATALESAPVQPPRDGI